MATLRQVLQDVKQNATDILDPEMILAAARQVGHVFRRRDLGPVETMLLFFIQVLHGNTAIAHLKHLADMIVTASAYCQARQALPVTLIRRVLEEG